MIEVISVNISEKKGTIKTPRPSIQLNNKGVKNDAHAGDWHRQVSLLAEESIRRFEGKLGRKIEYGEFAENITTSGIVLHETKPGDFFKIGETLLEVTQIGKKCHGKGCEIFQAVGNCVMPKEGIFCKVIKGGTIQKGDKIEYQKNYIG
ncbi:MAG: MOSC domain-containing protein [Salinivirgaceae bacterium]|jgi:molybdopterin adenylyltransferase|nr:MOSC domain-containing protein [Salinivirgaceae bacterium]